MPLRRLQPALDNRHPARKLLVLGGEQLECSLSAEGFFALRFNIFAECVDPLGHFLMVAIESSRLVLQASVNLIELLANGVKACFHACTHFLHLMFKRVESTLYAV